MGEQSTINPVQFQHVGRRQVTAEFSGGQITSDGGALLLREVDDRIGLLDRLAACFTDRRDPEATEHTVRDLVTQRVMGLALGYEDLNDHDDLSVDPVLATVVGKQDPRGQDRTRERDKGRPLATRSTLNRLELTPEAIGECDRYHKIVADFDAFERVFVEVFLDGRAEPPVEIILDIDATDDPLHGKQEGRFFHGDYNSYCYLPLYVFCGDDLLVAKLRESNIDASAGTVELLNQLIPQIRSRWPHVHIIVRADGGFAREAIMAWCEGNDVDHVFGLAKNDRLKKEITAELAKAKAHWEDKQQPAREFKEFQYRTLDSWSRTRRVVAKAEHLAKGPNPRFVVTSLGADQWLPRALYEDLYCARGEAENRIKEQQLCLFADRTSSKLMRSNQLRLWFSSAGYVLLNALRRLGLKGTSMARARCDTIRLRLLKIGAHVKVTLRRVLVSLATRFACQDVFVQACHQVQCLPLRC